MKYLFIFTLCTLLFGHFVYADGFAQALDKPVGDYIVNVDYDSFTKDIYAGNSTAFSFQLWNKDRTKMVPFNDVSVNVFRQDYTVTAFTGTLSAAFGQAGMGYTFQDAGSYTIRVRFHDADYRTLAEASFPLNVVSNGTLFGARYLALLIAVIIGIIAGTALSLVYRGVRKRKHA